MSARADEFDLGGLRLSVGEGRRIELSVRIDPLELGGERYEIEPEQVPVQLEVSRMTGGGYALRLRFEAALRAQCMRCLKLAQPKVEVQAREVDGRVGARSWKAHMWTARSSIWQRGRATRSRWRHR